MTHKLFLDTNIVIDYLARRAEFLPAANIMQLGLNGEVELYITPLTIANITYILRKDMTKELLKERLQTLCNFVHVAPQTSVEIQKAFNTQNPDLEDAIQYFSAETINADYIITRDPKHFRYAVIPVMNGTEFLEQYLL